MSTIILPDCFEDPVDFTLELVTQQQVSRSTYGGSEQAVDLLNDYWTATATVPSRTHDDAADLEAFAPSMRGRVNTVDLYHLVRPEPRGTMRGLPTLLSNAAQFAATFSIQTVAGATLLRGDMIGLGGLLLQIADPATANGAGVMVVKIVNRLRYAVLAGNAIVWNRPTAPFRLTSRSPVQYVPGYAPEVTFDFSEAVAG